MGEMDMAVENLSITVLELVIMQHVGMDQIHTLIDSLSPRLSLASRLHGENHNKPYESDNDKQESLHRVLITFH
jgi:hypothetical protein